MSTKSSKLHQQKPDEHSVKDLFTNDQLASQLQKQGVTSRRLCPPHPHFKDNMSQPQCYQIWKPTYLLEHLKFNRIQPWVNVDVGWELIIMIVFTSISLTERWVKDISSDKISLLFQESTWIQIGWIFIWLRIHEVALAIQKASGLWVIMVTSWGWHCTQFVKWSH